MPSAVGAIGMPVPSTQAPLAVHRIPNAPLPRLKMAFGGAPTSVTRKAARLMTQLFGPNKELKLVTIAAVLKRMNVSAIPLAMPVAFVAVAPETDSAPARP